MSGRQLFTLPASQDHDALAQQWADAPSVGLAADILSRRIVSGLVDDLALSASAFVVSHHDLVSEPLVKAAIALTPTSSSRQLDELPRLRQFLESHARSSTRHRVSELRKAIASFPRDPVLYAELARLFLVLGHHEKADRAIRVALRLAPTSRYILRSAARLLCSIGQPEQAFRLLSASPRTRVDPWLASAELATGTLVGREGAAAKRATRMLSSGAFSPLALTELASGVASVELAAGNRKNSRRLFQQALVAPNDNSLAQAEWAQTVERVVDFDVHSYDVPRKGEAMALDAFNRGEWAQVIAHCESWLMDSPFSRRPVLMAFDTAAVALDDIGTASLFCDAGLLADPADPVLLNNRAYALAIQDEPVEALKTLDDVPMENVGGEVRVCLTATRGLALFRAGRPDEGARHYLGAIEAASRLSRKSYRQLALLHYVRELLRSRSDVPHALENEVRGLAIDSASGTTAVMKQRIVALLDAARTKN